MVLGAEDEDAFWSSLEGDEIDANLHGVPPYDVGRATQRILQGVTARRVLDLGCGRGRLTNHIAALLGDPQQVHGVDICRPFLNRAVIDAERQHLGNVHYWHNDGRRLPPGLGGRRYDLAYSITMFQHIPDDAKWGYIRQVHDRLVPGGVFVFTVAVGEVDEFNNHQIADISSFCKELIEVGFHEVFRDKEPDENGWTWIQTWKDVL